MSRVRYASRAKPEVKSSKVTPQEPDSENLDHKIAEQDIQDGVPAFLDSGWTRRQVAAASSRNTKDPVAEDEALVNEVEGREQRRADATADGLPVYLRPEQSRRDSSSTTLDRPTGDTSEETELDVVALGGDEAAAGSSPGDTGDSSDDAAAGEAPADHNAAGAAAPPDSPPANAASGPPMGAPAPPPSSLPPASSGFTARVRAAQASGTPLPHTVRDQLQPVFGVDLRPVRVHTDGTGDAIARELGAMAVTVGTSIFFRSGRYDTGSPDGRRLLAHEVAHTAQQSRLAPATGIAVGVTAGGLESEAEGIAARVPSGAGAPGVPAFGYSTAPAPPAASGAVALPYLDPTQNTYTAAEVAGMPDADLVRAIDDLRRTLAGIGLEDPRATSLRSNMDLVLADMQRRQIALPGVERPRAATSTDQLASPGQMAALDAHYGALDALAERELAADAGPVRAKIAERRGWISAIHRDAVLDEGARVESLQRSIESYVQTRRVVPAKPITDPRMVAVDTGLRQSMRFAAAALLTTYEHDAIVGLEIARDDYLAGFAGMLLLTAKQLQTELPKLRDIPLVSNYKEGLFTRTPGGPWEGGDDVRTYQESLDRLTTGLAAYGDLGALAAGAPADRLVLLAQHGDALMEQIGQVQALIVAAQGIGLVAYFQEQISSRETFGDDSHINSMRSNIVEPMIAGLRLDRAPNPAAIERAQYEFERAAPEPEKEEDKKAQRERLATYEREHGIAEGAQSDTRRRFASMAKFDRDFGIFVGIAASIIAMVAASAAVGAVMRASVFTEGGALAAGQGLRVGAIRFAVQALTFTTVSQTTRGLLLGRAPTITEALETAAMDAATLGFMQAIGLPFTRIGQTPPTGFQFGALWAWSAGWQIGGLAYRGDLTLGSAAKAVVTSGVENVIMFKALEIAHQVGMLPTVDAFGNLFRPSNPAQHRALQAYIEAQQAGKRVNQDAAAWMRGARQPEVLDQILGRADAFLGKYRGALTQMKETGVMPESETTTLMTQSAHHMSAVRNVRDSLLLGLRPTGEQMMSYEGGITNVQVYLARMKRDNSITGWRPSGREGVFEVTYPDGRVRYFYPAGGSATRAPAPDFLIEAVERALPDATADHRVVVMQAVRRLPIDVAANLLAAAEGSPQGAKVLAFAARPEIALELSRPNSLYSAQFLTDAMAGNDSATALMARSEPPIVLQRWWQTAFEGVGSGGSRDLSRFTFFLDQVRLYRGSTSVNSVSEAQGVTKTLTETREVGDYSVARRPDAPTIRDPNAPVAPKTPDAADYFLSHGFSGRMKQIELKGITLYFSVDANGRLQRGFVFQNGVATPAFEIDIAGSVARLRQAADQLDQLGAGKEKEARAIVEGARGDIEALRLLRSMRNIDISRELALLDKVEFDPRGPNARAAEPVVDLPGPLAPPSQGPGNIFEPVTPSEILGVRQNTVEQRAARMGRSTDPIVRDALASQVRAAVTYDQQSAVRQHLDAAEKHLDALATAAYDATSKTLGPDAFTKVTAALFPGRSRIQIGEALDYMTRQPGFEPAGLERLAAVPEAQRKVLAQLDPALLAALGEVASRNPEGVKALLDQSALLLELQRNPGMAARFIELSHLLTGGDLPFSDVHRHLFGAIEYPQVFVQAMTDAVNAPLPAGVTGPAETTARLNALQAATNRANETGDRLAARLPADHPWTAQYQVMWAEARNAIEAYRAALEESVRNGVCPTNTGALEARMSDTLQRAFTIPLEPPQTPQQDVFFTLFSTLARGLRRNVTVAGPGMPGGNFPARVLPAATSMAQTQRLAYLELRGGPDDLKLIRDQLRSQQLVGPDGSPMPDVRFVISFARHDLNFRDIETRLNGLGPLRSRVVGLDLSGRESDPLTAANAQNVTAIVAKMNFQSLTTMLTAHPALVTELTTRLGADPLVTGRALEAVLATTPAGEPMPAAADLARLNRRVRDIVAEIDTREGLSRLPTDLLGVTIHAGEQIRSDARIDMLLKDVDASLEAGVDRIGHGIVLGVALPEGLANVGFARRADGSWSRPRTGGDPETYTADQLAAMEQQRLRLIRRVGDDGVTLEISPTSNIVLAGLKTGSHPIGEILAARPNIRIAVTTDNPSIHMADPAQELAIASAVSGATHPQMVRFYLEGFASRLGGRPIGNAATVRARIREALLTTTPEAARPEVILELESRFGIQGTATSSPTSMDAATFEARLEPFLNLLIR